MNKKLLYTLLFAWITFVAVSGQQKKATQKKQANTTVNKEDHAVKEEHALIGVTTNQKSAAEHNQHPDAQWYPEDGRKTQ